MVAMGCIAAVLFSLGQVPPLVQTLVEQNAASRGLIQDVEVFVSYEQNHYMPPGEAAQIESALSQQGISGNGAGIVEAVSGQRIFRGTSVRRQSGELASGSMEETIRNLASGHTEERNSLGAINSTYMVDIPSVDSGMLYTADRIDGRLTVDGEVARDRMGPDMFALGFAAGDPMYLDVLLSETSTDRTWSAEAVEDGYLLTVQVDEGPYAGARNEYVLDPERGYLITGKTSYGANGELVETVNVDLEKIADGIWFPSRVVKKTDLEFSTYTADQITINGGLGEDRFTLEGLLENPGRFTRIHKLADGNMVVQRYVDGEWKTYDTAGTYTPQFPGARTARGVHGEGGVAFRDTEGSPVANEIGSRQDSPDALANESAEASSVDGLLRTGSEYTWGIALGMCVVVVVTAGYVVRKRGTP